MKLLSIQKAHLIGIKGQGMTALAEVLVKNGVTVTGSDTAEVFTTDPILQKMGISPAVGFDAAHIPADADVIIFSTAYSRESNPELAAAYSTNVPLLSYPEALGLLTREKMTLAVCGTHGKTTTSALLAETLKTAELDPSAIIGSQIQAWGGNALSGQGEYLVLEADEYQNKLRYYEPFGVVLTSMDWDHPDFFETAADYERVFADFIRAIPRHGFLVACGDFANVAKLASEALTTTLTYGFYRENTFRITEYAAIDPSSEEGQAGFLQRFTVEHEDKALGSFRLRLSGRHNALNATAVLAVASHLHLPLEKVQAAFDQFTGTKRRFERIGECNGALVYDDYAHHPEEIKATLSAFRDLYPERNLSVIFHPHTFTRTKALLQEFSQSFDLADKVYLLEIYGSARETQGGVSSSDLEVLINKYFPGKAELVTETSEIETRLKKSLTKGDIIVTMGAGDVWHIAEHLAKK